MAGARKAAWIGIAGAIACAFVSCSHEWDAYDPRLGSATSGGGAGLGGGSTVSEASAGGAGPASSSSASTTGAGGTGGVGGAGGSPEPGSVHCAAHFPAVSSYLRHVMVDPAGGIVVVGPIQGDTDFGGGVLTAPVGRDSAAIAKLDSDCKHLWSKAFPASVNKTYFWSAAMWPSGDVAAVGGIDGAVDFGGGTLTPVGNEDTVVVRFDPAGNHVWSQSYGLAGAGQWPQSAAIDGSGDVLVFGVSYGGADFGGTPFVGNGVFLAKLSGTTGAPIWFKAFPSPSSRASSVAVDGSGGILLTGQFAGTIDFGGVMLAATGTARDGFVVKLDAAGDTVWARRFGSATGTVADYGHAVAPIGAGDVALTGRFDETLAFDSGPVTSAGDRDIFLTRLDASGTSSWTKRFGGASFDSALGLVVDASSNIVLAGRFEGTTDLGGVALVAEDKADAFVARYDGAGNHLWSRRFGGLGYESASAVSVDAAGRIVVTGYFDGVLDVGDRSFTATGYDGFVLVLWP